MERRIKRLPNLWHFCKKY